jgi:transposase-like protein
MKKVEKKEPVRKGFAEVVQLGLPGVVRQGLREVIFDEGMQVVLAMLEEERASFCGPRYAHDDDRRARRHGYTDGELVLGGRLVNVRRPRARDAQGEVTLPSWAAFRDRDPLNERAVEQMIVGVSTRKYDRSLEPVDRKLRTRGTSKSAVSRRFVAATEARVKTWLERDLSAIDPAVLMIDGLHVDEHVMLVALAIDVDGKKHVLGMREGATENATSCTQLLSDLQARGLRTDRAILAVLDGSKALAKAVRTVFGSRVRVQRCQAHKTRNVTDQLPESMRTSVKQAMRQAYRSKNVKRAKQQLENLARRLHADHPGAAASLEEGLDETLTVMEFGLPEWLERTLATTNAIENLIGQGRDLSRRVKRWRDARMIVRWLATACIEAEKRFHRVRDHKGLATLVAALRSGDHAGVAGEVQAA